MTISSFESSRSCPFMLTNLHSFKDPKSNTNNNVQITQTERTTYQDVNKSTTIKLHKTHLKFRIGKQRSHPNKKNKHPLKATWLTHFTSLMRRPIRAPSLAVRAVRNTTLVFRQERLGEAIWKNMLEYWLVVSTHLKPIGSMYGIFTYSWLIFMVNVGKYTIHGSYGKNIRQIG